MSRCYFERWCHGINIQRCGVKPERLEHAAAVSQPVCFVQLLWPGSQPCGCQARAGTARDTHAVPAGCRAARARSHQQLLHPAGGHRLGQGSTAGQSTQAQHARLLQMIFFSWGHAGGKRRARLQGACEGRWLGERFKGKQTLAGCPGQGAQPFGQQPSDQHKASNAQQLQTLI